jgi:predicted phage tail protein
MLAEAKPAAIKDECHRILDENGPSRYFHACSNAIVQGTPVENVLAMYAVR